MTAPFLLQQLVDRAAALHGERVAIVTPKDHVTYRELAERSRVVESALIALGVGVGEPVGLAMEKSTDSIAALLGVLRAGACYVPLDPFAPKSRLDTILSRARIRVLLSTSSRATELAEGLLGADEPPLTLETILTPGDAAPRAIGRLGVRSWSRLGIQTGDPPITESHLAYILHTSGSTGVPKGVAVTHRAAMSFVEMAATFFSASPDDVFACHAPLTFDLSVFDLFVAMYAGARVFLLPEHYAAFPKKIAETIATERVTIWNSVVSALSLLTHRVDLSRHDLSSVRLCIFSGEVMPMGVLRPLRAAMPSAELYNLYGQTEANSSLYYKVDEIPADDGARLPIGRPFPNFDAYALTESGSPVTPGGDPGELYVRGPCVAAGYYADPERTRERFVEDPLTPGLGRRVYKTGDRVRLDAEGRYWFLGRADNLVKVRGYRVELSEVELALTAAPGVAEAAVMAVPDEEVGHHLVAFARPRSGETLEAAALAAHLALKLPKYMIPDPLTIVAELPRTATGKIDKKALLASLGPPGEPA